MGRSRVGLDEFFSCSVFSRYELQLYTSSPRFIPKTRVLSPISWFTSEFLDFSPISVIRADATI
jgi:hypothetical protein